MADSGHGKSRKPLASARPSGLDQVDAGWETCNRLSPPPLSRPPVASVPRPSSRPSAPVPKRVVSSLPPSPPSSGRSIAVPSPPRPSAAVTVVGLGISVAMQGAPPSASMQSPQLSVAAARPPTPKVQLEELDANRLKPAAAVASGAVQPGASVVAGQALKPSPTRKVHAQRRRTSAAIAPQRTPPRDEAVESHAAVEGGPSWLVRAQQQEAAKESPER